MMEHKSERMMQTALANGWKAQVIPDIPLDGDVNNIVWNLYCIREKEAIFVRFVGNRQDSAVYSYSTYKSCLHSRHFVIERLTGRPNPRWLKEQVKQEDFNSVPWDKDAPAIDILLKVLGKEILWIRKLDGQMCKATIFKDINLGSPFFRVRESPPQSGKRVLEWVDREGFHSVRLDAIIDVS